MEQSAPDVTVQVGDAVAALLLTRVEERLDVVHHVRVTTFREGPRGRWDEPTRRRLAATLEHGSAVVVDGQRRTEPLAEQRWLAWFPRPFGPHHAVNVASPVVDWVVARHPVVTLVRAHQVARAWQAELLQAAGILAATSWGSRRVERWLARGSRVANKSVRWASLVEATAGDDAPVRAWAWGRGPRDSTAAIARHLPAPSIADELSMPDPHLSPDDARDVLDALAGAGTLRWSIADPEQR